MEYVGEVWRGWICMEGLKRHVGFQKGMIDVEKAWMGLKRDGGVGEAWEDGEAWMGLEGQERAVEDKLGRKPKRVMKRRDKSVSLP